MIAAVASAAQVADDIERRAVGWAASCRSSPYRGLSPRETFEAVLEGMRATPFRLPPALVGRVRELLPHPEQPTAPEGSPPLTR